MEPDTYIEIDSTHRIRLAPNGSFYPQHIINSLAFGSGNVPSEEWTHYRLKSGELRRFNTEKAARAFVAKDIAKG